MTDEGGLPTLGGGGTPQQVVLKCLRKQVCASHEEQASKQHSTTILFLPLPPGPCPEFLAQVP